MFFEINLSNKKIKISCQIKFSMKEVTTSKMPTSMLHQRVNKTKSWTNMEMTWVISLLQVTLKSRMES